MRVGYQKATINSKVRAIEQIIVHDPVKFKENEKHLSLSTLIYFSRYSISIPPENVRKPRFYDIFRIIETEHWTKVG